MELLHASIDVVDLRLQPRRNTERSCLFSPWLQQLLRAEDLVGHCCCSWNTTPVSRHARPSQTHHVKHEITIVLDASHSRCPLQRLLRLFARIQSFRSRRLGLVGQPPNLVVERLRAKKEPGSFRIGEQLCNKQQVVQQQQSNPSKSSVRPYLFDLLVDDSDEMVAPCCWVGGVHDLFVHGSPQRPRKQLLNDGRCRSGCSRHRAWSCSFGDFGLASIRRSWRHLRLKCFDVCRPWLSSRFGGQSE